MVYKKPISASIEKGGKTMVKNGKSVAKTNNKPVGKKNEKVTGKPVGKSIGKNSGKTLAKKPDKSTGKMNEKSVAKKNDKKAGKNVMKKPVCIDISKDCQLYKLKLSCKRKGEMRAEGWQVHLESFLQERWDHVDGCMIIILAAWLSS